MSSLCKSELRQFSRARSQQSCFPLKQGRMGTPLSNWKAQEQAALSTNKTSLSGRPKMRRSFTKYPSLEIKQCSRYSRCWMRSPSGSRKFRISFAQQEWLAVKIITSNFPFKLCSNSTAPGLMFMPASAISPVGNLMVILRSCSCCRFQLQWMSVQSRSKTMVFLFSEPWGRCRERIFDLISYFAGIFEFYSVLRICRLCERCSLAADCASRQFFTTSEMQYVGLRGEQGFRIASCTALFSGTWMTNPLRESFLYLGLPWARAASSSCWESLRICALRCCMRSCFLAVRRVWEKLLMACSLRSMFSILRRAEATSPVGAPESYSISMLSLLYLAVLVFEFEYGRNSLYNGTAICSFIQ